MLIKNQASKKKKPSNLNKNLLYERENHFFSFDKKKQYLFDPLLEKKLKKRLKPFNINPIDCPIFVSKKKLYFFQLAALFVTSQASWIQIHPNAFKYSFLRKSYPLDEILAHEMVHFARKDLQDSSFFEEWLAYQTSTSYRRYIGPHIHLLLIFSLLFSFAAWMNAFYSLPFLFLLPLIPCCILFWRERTIRKVKKLIPKTKQMATLLRMSYEKVKKGSKAILLFNDES